MMVQKFTSFVTHGELDENTLFTTPAEKDALVKDKGRVATAFLFNFFGMLGMINGAPPAQKTMLLNSFKKDQKLRIDTIDDTNLDISLSVKLAHDADFFTSVNTVNEITRFLVKLKAGQIDKVDPIIVGKWAAGMKPSFGTSLPDLQLRTIWNVYRNDEGKSIDPSFLAVRLKRRVNQNNDTGDFGRYAKRILGINEIPHSSTVVLTPTAGPLAATTPIAAVPIAPTNPVVPQKLSYYMKQKLKKQAAAGQTPAAPAAPTQTAAPAGQKLSYYMKQKLKKQGFSSLADAEAAKKAAAAAAYALSQKAEAEAKARQEAAAKAEAERIKALGEKGIPDAVWDAFDQYMFDQTSSAAKIYTTRAYRKEMGLAETDPLPENVIAFTDAVERLVFRNLYRFSPFVSSFETQLRESISKATDLYNALKEIAKYKPGTTADELLKHVLSKGMLVAMDTSLNADHLSRHRQKMMIMAVVLYISHPGFTIEDFKKYYIPISKLLSYEVMMNHIGLIQDNKMMTDELFDAMSQGISENAIDRYISSNNIRWILDVDIDYQTGAITASSRKALILNMIFNKWKVTPAKISTVINDNGYSSTDMIWGKLLMVAGSSHFGFPDSLSEFYDKLKSYVKNGIRSDLEHNPSLLQAVMGVSRDVSSPHFRYDPAVPASAQIVPAILHDMFTADLEENGPASSKLFKLHPGLSLTDYRLVDYLKVLAVDTKKMVSKTPSDPGSISIAAEVNIADVTVDQLVILISHNQSKPDQPLLGAKIVKNFNSARLRAGGDPQEVIDRTMAALATLYETDPRVALANSYMSEQLIKFLPRCSKDVMLQFMRHAAKIKDTHLMTHETYKNLYKNDKQSFVDAMQSVMQDAIGTDVEDYVNELMDDMPQHVKQKMRQNLIGASIVIDDIQKGAIKPFADIDSNRLKQILHYNDLDLSSLLPSTEKKKKGEKFTEYFVRVKKAAAGAGLHPLKVADSTIKGTDMKVLNKGLVEQHHAGNHGDIYPLIHRVHEVDLVNPEFDKFRDQHQRDGAVTPAFHGTGGIAAAMILRYGFRVLKSTDSSVVGRMLGDGIYFSNKIDKALQYVSNGGYGRQIGSRGYILRLDTNLGTSPTNYRAAGVGGRDGIRSPEWCVFDSKAQLRILQAYEVSLERRRTVDRHLKEDTNRTMSFKAFLKEETASKIFNTTAFVFRDGLIPIIAEDDEVRYVDFEDALKDGLISPDMFDQHAQGPMIVFDDTLEQEIYDWRHAEHMIGDPLKLYKQLFRAKMKSSVDE